MSRHRQVANDLKYNDYADDDEYDDDYAEDEYEEDYYEDEEPAPKQAYQAPKSASSKAPTSSKPVAKDDSTDKIAQIRAIIGPGVPDKKIIDLLKQHNGNVDQVTNALLDLAIDEEAPKKTSPQKPQVSSQEPIQKSSLASLSSNPLSSLQASGSSGPTNYKPITLSALGNSGGLKSLVSASSPLQSLTPTTFHNLQKPSESNSTNTSKAPLNLSSLQNAGGLPALKSLSVQTSSTKTNGPSTAPLTLNSLGGSGGLKALAAQSAKPNTPLNLSSLGGGFGSLNISSPAGAQIPPPSTTTTLNLSSLSSGTTLKSLRNPPAHQTPAPPSQSVPKSTTTNSSRLDSHPIKSAPSKANEESLPPSEPAVKPSPLADFWFSTPPKEDSQNSTSLLNEQHPHFDPSFVLADNAFKFDEPSPDDIMLSARANMGTPTPKKQPQAQIMVHAPGKSLASVHPKKAEPAKQPTRETKPVKKDEGSSSTSSSTTTQATIDAAIRSNKNQKGKVNVVEEYAKRLSEKPNLNLVVIGHVDAGKSTLVGHLLVLLGVVDERTMKKYERDAEKMKKGSFAFAWVLDETEEERSRGVTIDVGITSFESQKHKFILLDAPGHKDFVPNMISGAAQADVAILVVDSGIGGFESGFDNGGQTREHSLLARSLGVSQLVVAVNQLDKVEWSESRFNEIKATLLIFLTQAGFRKDKVHFVPCSGYIGENLILRTDPKLSSWYKGPTLLEILDKLEPPQRPIDKPFRLSIRDLFKGAPPGTSGGALSVSGRIESGFVQVGDFVLLMPPNEIGQVKSIEAAEESVKWAAAGDLVSLGLANIDLQHISVGNVLCAPEAPIPVVSHFRAKILTFELEVPLTIGVPIVLQHQSSAEPATISKLLSLLNKSTGEVIKKNPRALMKQSSAEVEIKLARPICLETIADSKELGRFTLRSGGSVAAAGVAMPKGGQPNTSHSPYNRPYVNIRPAPDPSIALRSSPTIQPITQMHSSYPQHLSGQSTPLTTYAPVPSYTASTNYSTIPVAGYPTPSKSNVPTKRKSQPTLDAMGFKKRSGSSISNRKPSIVPTTVIDVDAPLSRLPSRPSSSSSSSSSSRDSSSNMGQVVYAPSVPLHKRTHTMTMSSGADSERDGLEPCPVCGTMLTLLSQQDAEAHVAECLELACGGGSEIKAEKPKRGRPSPPRESSSSSSMSQRKVIGTHYVVSLWKVEASTNECIICFEGFEVAERVATMNCFCIYHERCIQSWFSKGGLCPVHREE